MARVELSDISVTFRIFDAGQRSFFRRVLPLVKDQRYLDITALNGLSLTLEPGSRVALLGTNSAGKTTLLRVIAGLVPPLRGKVVTDGRPGAVFSMGFGAIPDACLADLAYAQGLLMGYGPAAARTKVDEILDFAELTASAKCPVHITPPGALARFGIAAILCLGADILLLDELLESVDPYFHSKLEAAITQRIEQGAILVMAEKSRSLLSHFCTEAILLHDGRITAQGGLLDLLPAAGALLTY